MNLTVPILSSTISLINMDADAATMQALVLGLTGPFGAGCTEVAQILAEEGFVRISLSDIVLEGAASGYPDGKVKYTLLPKQKDA